MSKEKVKLQEDEEVIKRISHIKNGEVFLREIDGIVDDLLDVFVSPSDSAEDSQPDTRNRKRTMLLWHVAKNMKIEAFSADVWRWWRKNTSLVSVFGTRIINEPVIDENLTNGLGEILEEIIFSPQISDTRERTLLETLLKQGRIKLSADQRSRVWGNIRSKKEDLGSPYSLWILNDPNSTKEEFLEIAQVDLESLVWSEAFFFKGSEERSGLAIDWLIQNMDCDLEEIITKYLLLSPYTNGTRINHLIARIGKPELFSEELVSRPEINWARLGVKLLLLWKPEGIKALVTEEKWADILKGLDEKDELFKIMLTHKNREIRERAIKALGKMRPKEAPLGLGR